MDIYGNEVYNIRQVLKELAEIHREMLGVISKPEKPVTKVLKFIVLIAGATNILYAVEKIINLIKGWV